MGYSPMSSQDPMSSPMELLAGHALRVTLWCGTVSALRYYLLQRSDEKPKQRLKRRALYAAVEAGVGTVLCGPTMTSVFMNVPRFTCSFVLRMNEALSIVDRFEVAAFHRLAEECIPLDDAVPYTAWVLGSLLSNLGLLIYTKKKTSRKVSVAKVGFVSLLQGLARFTAPSFVVSLPRNEAELMVAMAAVLLDKYTTSWLAHNITPWE